MYQIRMIHIRSSGSIPNSLYQKKIYGITTRKTLFGIHRPYQKIGFDEMCSKTTLLLGTNQVIAQQMLDRMHELHQRGISWKRTLSDQDLISEHQNLTSIMPLEIIELSMSDMIKLCQIHYFDMYITHSIETVDHSTSDWLCYEYNTLQRPNRAMVEQFMRDMLYLH